MKIKSFTGACKKLNVDPKSVDVFKTLPKEYKKYMTDIYKLTIITQAINENKKANWNDSNEPKYFPWFEIKATKSKPSGVGFSDSHYARWLTGAFVGSRLSFRNREDCLYAIKQFESLYKVIILYIK